MHRRWLLRGLLLGFSTVLGLVLAEGGLRILRPDPLREDGRSLAQKLADSESSAPDSGDTISLRGLIRASRNPRLVYELKPGLRGTFHHAAFTINADGYRGPLRPRPRMPGSRRILGIGDSVLFGWGVRDEETFLARLEQRLGPGSEALNFGVPGYNTMQESEQLESTGILYAPDAVVLAWVDNDHALPNFMLRPDGSLLQRIELFRQIARGGGEDLVEAGPRRVPPEYVSMVGHEAVEHALQRIGYLARRHAFRAFVFCYNGRKKAIERVRGWCLEHGLGFLDLQAWRSRNGLLDEQALQLSSKDMHPSPAYHASIAEFLHEQLARQLP